MIATVGSIAAWHAASSSPAAVMRSVIVASLTVMPTDRLAAAANEVGQHRFELALADAEALDAAMADDARRRLQRRDRRRHVRVPHRLHLGRHARQGEHGARRPGGRLESHVDARRRAVLVGNRRGAGGKVGLHGVPLRHLAAAAGEQAADVLERRLVAHQPDARHRGQRFAREIVGRRPQAAGGDDDVDPPHGRLKRRDVVGQVVADGRVKRDLDAALGEPLGQPLAVGVEPLAGRQLVADGDDLGTHAPQVCSDGRREWEGPRRLALLPRPTLTPQLTRGPGGRSGDSAGRGSSRSAGRTTDR